MRESYARDIYINRVGSAAKVTYGEAVLRWLDTAPKSMLSHIRNTLPYLEHCKLIEVPHEAYEMRSDMLKRGLSPQTINRRLACVRRVLNLAYSQWDWLEQPLAKKVELLSEKNTSRDVTLTRDEMTALVAAMDSKEAKKASLLAAFTGLRRGEVLSLKPESWKAPHIHLKGEDTKSGKARTVPVIAEMHHLLDTLPFELTSWELRTNFEKARVEIGRPELRFHDLRHTFATWLVENPDIPITVIRDLLGHSSLAVTSRYANMRGSHLHLVESALGTKK